MCGRVSHVSAFLDLTQHCNGEASLPRVFSASALRRGLCCVVRCLLKRHNLLHFEVFILETIAAMNYKYETIVVASLSSRHHAANLPATLSTTFNIQLTMACIVHM